MSNFEICQILAKYGIETDDRFWESIPDQTYSETHKDEQDLIPIRY